MTYEQAYQLKEDLNKILNDAKVDVVSYEIFNKWTELFVKTYELVLIPTEHEGKYETATDSQKLAFARVSIQSQTGAAASYETFVSTFNTLAENDTELNDYLNQEEA
jgi:hypothetical protein